MSLCPALLKEREETTGRRRSRGFAALDNIPYQALGDIDACENEAERKKRLRDANELQFVKTKLRLQRSMAAACSGSAGTSSANRETHPGGTESVSANNAGGAGGLLASIASHASALGGPSANGAHYKHGTAAGEYHALMVREEAMDTPFCPLQEKFHAFVLRGLRNIS